MAGHGGSWPGHLERDEVGCVTQQQQAGEEPLTADEPGPVAVAFGQRVRALRGDRSLRAFAAEIGRVSAGLLCEIERGKAKPSPRVVARLDELSGAGPAGGLASQYPALVQEWEARKRLRAARREQLAAEERHWRSGQGATNRAFAEYPGRGPAGGVAGAAPGTGEVDVNRRQAVMTIGALLLAGATRARSLLRAAESSNVGPLTLDEYHEAVEALTRNAYVQPVAVLLRKADQLATEVAGLLLEGRHSSRQRLQLELLTGQLSYLQGDFAFRLGDHQAARSHLRVARHYGEELGNHVLLASAATVATYLLLYQGRFEQALVRARAVRPYATEHTSARLATLEARALAGVDPTAQRDLDALIGEAEAAVPDRPAFEPGASAPFGPEMFTFHAATAAVRARQPRAEELAREAVAQYEALAAAKSERFMYAHLALSRLELATALLQSKLPEPEEAARLGLRALALPPQLHEDTVKRRAGELLAVFSGQPAWRSLATVEELAEALRGYGPRRALAGTTAGAALDRPERPERGRDHAAEV